MAKKREKKAKAARTHSSTADPGGRSTDASAPGAATPRELTRAQLEALRRKLVKKYH